MRVISAHIFLLIELRNATVKGGEEGGNSGSEKAVIGLWKSIILPAI